MGKLTKRTFANRLSKIHSDADEMRSAFVDQGEAQLCFEAERAGWSQRQISAEAEACGFSMSTSKVSQLLMFGAFLRKSAVADFLRKPGISDKTALLTEGRFRAAWRSVDKPKGHRSGWTSKQFSSVCEAVCLSLFPPAAERSSKSIMYEDLMAALAEALSGAELAEELNRRPGCAIVSEKQAKDAIQNFNQIHRDKGEIVTDYRDGVKVYRLTRPPCAIDKNKAAKSIIRIMEVFVALDFELSRPFNGALQYQQHVHQLRKALELCVSAEALEDIRKEPDDLKNYKIGEDPERVRRKVLTGKR